MQPFQELRVWIAAHGLTLEVYCVTRTFPADERFGLTSQLRRSAASVAANIAEGSAAAHPADFARVLNVAEKEAAETAYHLLLARDLGYLREADWASLIEKLGSLRRMLQVFRRCVLRAVDGRPSSPVPPKNQ
jgi:four helix bundle protein